MSADGDFDSGMTYSPPHYHKSTSHGRAPSPPPARYGHRSLSPDYHSGGSPYVSGALPPRGDPHSHSRPRIEYDHPDVFFAPPPPGTGLQPPRQHYRPRSVPPPMTRDRDRDRDERRRRDDEEVDPDDPHKNSHNPIGKVQHVLHHTFSQSTSGLGVGVLGAIVGGLSAREASLAASRRVGHGKGGSESDKAALLSTIVGAAVGGLGANALEKRIESNRKKDRDEQDAWERKWGKDGSRGDRDRDDRNRDRDRDRDREHDRDGRGSRDLVPARDRGRRGGLADDYYISDDDDRDHVYDDRNGNRRSQSRHR